MSQEGMTTDGAAPALADPERWVDDHADALYGFALARVRDPEAARELVQEAFLAALRSRATFRGHSSERTWLIGILKHKVIDHFRGIYHDREILAADETSAHSSGEFDERGHWRARAGPRDWGRDAAQALEDEEFWRAFEQCRAALSGRIGAAFTLRELDELPTEDVCKVLNVTPTNLWVMLHRARTQLRRCLELNWFGRVPREGPGGAKR